MAITASAVKELRLRTGAGMMDCKKALVETDGDLEAAADYLRAKGIAKAAKKADRVAAEGLVGTFISADGLQGSVVEVNCETDFVARNEEFQQFTADLAELVVSQGIDNVDALLGAELGGSPVEEVRKSKIASIGENINVRRAMRMHVESGIVGTYIHNQGAIGVLVSLRSPAALDPSGAASALARDIAMHVAAVNPHFVSEADIDETVIEKERAVLIAQAEESGKPPEIAAKMVEGRLRKFRKEICLLDQPFVKNPDLSVAGEVDRVAKELGTELQVASFARFVRGEGIEKVESNLADEVAALQK